MYHNLKFPLLSKDQEVPFLSTRGVLKTSSPSLEMILVSEPTPWHDNKHKDIIVFVQDAVLAWKNSKLGLKTSIEDLETKSQRLILVF